MKKNIGKYILVIGIEGIGIWLAVLGTVSILRYSGVLLVSPPTSTTILYLYEGIIEYIVAAIFIFIGVLLFIKYYKKTKLENK